MTAPTNKMSGTRVTLDAITASDLMTTNPISVRDTATIREVTALLIDKGFSAAPVIDEAGRPVGVVSRSDLLVHDREREDYVPATPDYYAEEAEAKVWSDEKHEGFQVVHVDRTPVSEIMTPVVFAVAPETSARKVVAEMRSLRVHRLFVVDRGGVLIGVISALDVLNHLD